jgi:hypothetical protein
MTLLPPLAPTEEINNRGDIIATAIDSRQPTVLFTYFLALFDE